MDTKALIFNMQKFSLNDGPGIRTVVFFKGCPLRCKWCSNPESQNPEFEELCLGNEQCREVSIDTIVEYCLQDLDFYEESGGGVTLSGGEPLMQKNAALFLLTELKSRKINTAVETTGFVSPAFFKEVLPRIDTVLFDVKHYQEKQHQEGTGVSNELILSNLRYAVTHEFHVLPRIPVIPGFNNSAADAEGFSSLFCGLGIKSVQLLPFHQFGERKYELLDRKYSFSDVPALHSEDLEEYRQVFFQNGIHAFF